MYFPVSELDGLALGTAEGVREVDVAHFGEEVHAGAKTVGRVAVVAGNDVAFHPAAVEEEVHVGVLFDEVTYLHIAEGVRRYVERILVKPAQVVDAAHTVQLVEK